MSKTAYTALVSAAAKSAGMAESQAKSAIDSFLSTIHSELVSGNDVAVGSLATIKSEVRAARTGRNPSTGATINIPEKRVASFKASTSLKNALASASTK
jgi:DNA-binding protein HU-beta